jgi:hypothetical protein
MLHSSLPLRYWNNAIRKKLIQDIGIEPDEAAYFHETDAAFIYETTDEPWLDPEVFRRLLNVKRLAVRNNSRSAHWYTALLKRCTELQSSETALRCSLRRWSRFDRQE